MGHFDWRQIATYNCVYVSKMMRIYLNDTQKVDVNGNFILVDIRWKMEENMQENVHRKETFIKERTDDQFQFLQFFHDYLFQTIFLWKLWILTSFISQIYLNITDVIDGITIIWEFLSQSRFIIIRNDSLQPQLSDWKIQQYEMKLKLSALYRKRK